MPEKRQPGNSKKGKEKARGFDLDGEHQFQSEMKGNHADGKKARIAKGAAGVSVCA